jgi:hypothetical protein
LFVTAAIVLPLWPWTRAAAYLSILALLGLVLLELCLTGPNKLPFACSYLPGRTNVHLTIGPVVALITTGIVRGALVLRQAIDDIRQTAMFLLALAVAAALVRFFSKESELIFDDIPEPVVLGLGLHRDGAPFFD